MRRVISTIIAVAFITSMFANTAFAGDHHGGGISPLWIPVALFTTLTAIAITQPQPVIYERHINYEPVRTVRYEEPRYIRSYDRGPQDYCQHEHDRSYRDRYRDRYYR
jgi:hypothetical protein